MWGRAQARDGREDNTMMEEEVGGEAERREERVRDEHQNDMTM